MIISFHSIDQETAEPHHFLIDWIKGYWSNTQRCKMFFYSKAEKKTCNTYWEKSNCLIIEILRHKPTNFDIKSLSLNQSEWMTEKVTFELSWTDKKKRIGKYARPCSSDLRCASLSLHSDADISLSKYANNQLRKQSDLKCVRLFLPLKICHWYIRYLLEKCLKPFLWSYLKVCWGKSENSWKLNWVCWNV